MKLYYSKKYLSITRIMAYLEQYKYIKDGDKVLEIGSGGGLFGEFAKKIASYRSMDIDKDTKPDLLGDICKYENIKKYNNNFDVIFCCQVLEHMPIEQSKIAIKNLSCLGAKKIIISIPNNMISLKFRLKIPFVDFKKVVTIPFTGVNRNLENNKYNKFEIYYNNYK